MPEARERTPSRVSAVVERISPVAYAVSAGVVVIGVLAGFGGLETVEDAPVARAETGEVVPGKQLDVTIEDAWLADGFDPYVEPEDGNRFLAVRATVTNVSDTPVSTLDDNVLVDGVVGVSTEPEADQVMRLGESSSTPVFQPGVEQEVVLLWEIPDTEIVEGRDLTVSVLDKTLTKGFLFADSWNDPVVTAEVAVRVGDRGREYMADEVDEYSDVVAP